MASKSGKAFLNGCHHQRDAASLTLSASLHTTLSDRALLRKGGMRPCGAG